VFLFLTFVENDDTSDFVTVVVTDFILETGVCLLELMTFFLRAKESIFGLEETSWPLDLALIIVLLISVAITRLCQLPTIVYRLDPIHTIQSLFISDLFLFIPSPPLDLAFSVNLLALLCEDTEHREKKEGYLEK